METKPHTNPVDAPPPQGITAIWSMMLPGIGQMMKGQPMAGVIWAIGVAGGYYAFFWPGITLHVLCIIDAAFSKGDASWVGLKTWPQRLASLGLVVGLAFYVFYRNF